MENQSNDQPLKWIERIKYGLSTKGYFLCYELLTEDMLNSIFTNIREKSQRMGNFVDFDVSLEDKDYLLRLSASNWKLIPKGSLYHKMALNLSNHVPKNSPISNKIRDDDYPAKRVPIIEELGKLVKDLSQSLKQGVINPEMIMTIVNCNNILLKMILKQKKLWTKRRIQKRQENIKRYKSNHSWLSDKEWEKLSFFEKIMKRWNFTDMHQCLVPWEEKKLSKEELNLFWEKKRKWRLARMIELKNNPLQRKVFDEFCHARKIGYKVCRNLDKQYRDVDPSDTIDNRKMIIHRKY